MDPASPGWIDNPGQRFDRRSRERLRRPDSWYRPIDDLATIIDASRYHESQTHPAYQVFGRDYQASTPD